MMARADRRIRIVERAPQITPAIHDQRVGVEPENIGIPARQRLVNQNEFGPTARFCRERFAHVRENTFIIEIVNVRVL
jgi:hypothetical protein